MMTPIKQVDPILVVAEDLSGNLKLATLEKSVVKKLLGQLQPTDRQNVADVLKQMYSQW